MKWRLIRAVINNSVNEKSSGRADGPRRCPVRVLHQAGPVTRGSERDRKEGRGMSEGARRTAKAGAADRPPRRLLVHDRAQRGEGRPAYTRCIQLYGQIRATLCKWCTRATRPRPDEFDRVRCADISTSPPERPRSEGTAASSTAISSGIPDQPGARGARSENRRSTRRQGGIARTRRTGRLGRRVLAGWRVRGDVRSSRGECDRLIVARCHRPRPSRVLHGGEETPPAEKRRARCEPARGAEFTRPGGFDRLRRRPRRIAWRHSVRETGDGDRGVTDAP